MFFIPVKTQMGSLSRASRIFTDQGRHDARSLFSFSSDDTPVNQYLPWLNVFISALLFLAAWAYRNRSDVPEGLWLFLLLPGVIFGMVFVARRSMAEIETGLADLKGLRYGYKGA
jgi:hypothetical protein